MGSEPEKNGIRRIIILMMRVVIEINCVNNYLVKPDKNINSDNHLYGSYLYHSLIFIINKAG